MVTAVIFGAGGQDGFYLSKSLLQKGYRVIGVIRRSSIDNTIRLSTLLNNNYITLVEGDVTDGNSVQNIIKKHTPDEVYNLAAQSHVGTSFTQPTLTWNVTAGGCVNILEAIRFVKPDTKFYQASSSEMFGKSFTQDMKPDLSGYIRYQNEKTPMTPQSPYAVAKLAAHHMVRLYRDSYGLFACSGILMNHESPMRGENFVTRKITKWIGEYKNCISDYLYMGGPVFDSDYIYAGEFSSIRYNKLRLGNISVYRDWGHAEDYVEAMYLMMQHENPDDYVVSTMSTYSVEDFLRVAFFFAGLGDWRNYVVIDPNLFRPCEVDFLMGDSSKIRNTLGWEPKYDFISLVKEMVEADIEKAKRAG